MATSKAWLAAALVVLVAAPASARNVTIQGQQGRDRVSVSLPRAQAEAFKSSAAKLQRAGAETYLNIWVKKSRASASYPGGQGASLVAKVNDRGRWLDNYGKNTIGFISNGSPSFPGYSGYVRVGEHVFTYSTIRAGERHTHTYATTPQNVRNWRHEHVESTFEVSPEMVKAFNVFYMARSNAALVSHKTVAGKGVTKGQYHLPRWVNPGNSSFYQEGCAGASTSSLNPHWVKAFKYSITSGHLARVGQEMLRNPSLNAEQRKVARAFVEATPGMADQVAQFARDNGLKQCTTPKALVREFAYNSPQSKRITIFNPPAGDIPSSGLKSMQWDQRHARYDGDKGWNGLGKFPYMPDKAPGERVSSSFRNVRFGNALSTLTGALGTNNGGGGNGGGTNPPPTTLVNINRATAAQLDRLPRIGGVKAQRIVQFREANGQFSSVQDLQRVRGIGASTVNLLRPLVTAQ